MDREPCSFMNFKFNGSYITISYISTAPLPTHTVYALPWYKMNFHDGSADHKLIFSLFGDIFFGKFPSFLKSPSYLEINFCHRHNRAELMTVPSSVIFYTKSEPVRICATLGSRHFRISSRASLECALGADPTVYFSSCQN